MTALLAARFAVTLCPACQEPCAVELRHAAISCPRCQAKVEMRGRSLLWQGDDARDAQAAASQASRRGAIPDLVGPERIPRHDSPADAAAAQAKSIINKSARAEAVALWLDRIAGPVPHRLLVDSLERAGLDQDRAEAEITRMLALDLLMEPRSGYYRAVGPP